VLIDYIHPTRNPEQAMRTPTISLTTSQVKQFQSEGFLSIPALTTQEDIADLRESYDRIFSDLAGRDRGDQFDLAGTDEEGKRQSLPQILHPAQYAPEMNDSQLLINAAHVARQLLGPDATCEFAHAIFKPAGYGAETPWHQDAAYWSPELLYTSVSIWVPLQEATPENGCMEFVPLSHNLDVLRHQSINNDPRIHGLELHPDESKHVANKSTCPLPPGGATFHGPYMLHHTGPNTSQIPRRALILNAGLPPRQRTSPRHFPWQEVWQTAREARATAATERGINVGAAPTGEIRPGT
jgi:ectoine hydroxylase-related dioxygenase (phytanoyl-CoA dioxygenase family)